MSDKKTPNIFFRFYFNDFQIKPGIFPVLSEACIGCNACLLQLRQTAATRAIASLSSSRHSV